MQSPERSSYSRPGADPHNANILSRASLNLAQAYQVLTSRAQLRMTHAWCVYEASFPELGIPLLPCQSLEVSYTDAS